MAYPRQYKKNFKGSPQPLRYGNREQAGEPEDQESVVHAEYFIRDMLGRLDYRSLFYENIANCERCLIGVDNGNGAYSVFWMWLALYPIIVGYAPNATDPYDPAIVNYNTWVDRTSDFKDCRVVVLQKDDRAVYEIFNDYLATIYKRDNVSILQPCNVGTLADYKALDVCVDTALDDHRPNYWLERKGHLFANGIEDVKSYGGKMSTTWGNSLDKGTWSEAMWPELPFLATRYIDNVGVFMPDYCDVDYNASHAVGEDLIVLRQIRAPNIAAESGGRQFTEVMAVINFLGGGAGQGGAAAGQAYDEKYGNAFTTTDDMGFKHQFTEGQGGAAKGAGIAQGIKNTIGYAFGIFARQASYFRWVYPRIRAFGRQTTPVQYYGEYSAAFDRAFGSPNATIPNSNVGYRKFWNNLHVIKLPVDAYNAWVEPLRAYVEAQA